MGKNMEKIASDVRKIYIAGGSDTQIFDFIRANIEKLTKSQYSFIATLDYDIVEKRDYLYVNSASSTILSNSTTSEDNMSDITNVDELTTDESLTHAKNNITATPSHAISSLEDMSPVVQKKSGDGGRRESSKRISTMNIMFHPNTLTGSDDGVREPHSKSSKGINPTRSSVSSFASPPSPISHLSSAQPAAKSSQSKLRMTITDTDSQELAKTSKSIISSLRAHRSIAESKKHHNINQVNSRGSQEDGGMEDSASATPVAQQNSLKNNYIIYNSGKIMPLNNIFGRVIRSDSTVIENNIQDLGSIGSIFPENFINSDGSTEINTFMGAPVICAGLVIGIICCMNADKYAPKTYEKINELVEICAVYMMWYKERKSEAGQKNTLNEIKKGSRDGIIDIDAKCKILEMNTAAEEITGYESHGAIGKNFMKFFPNKELRRGITEYVMRVYNKKTTTIDGEITSSPYDSDNSSEEGERSRFLGDTGELAIRQKDGGITYVTLRFVKTSFKTMLVMIRSVDDMVRDKKIAEQSNEYKDLFVANVTHELKTPLNGILGMGVQLLKTELTDKQRQYCNIIVNSGEELSKIIGDILDLSKLEGGKLGINPKPFSISDCIESCHRTVDFSIKDKQLEYSQKITPKVPSAIIGDSDRIRQIIGNLLSNAVKFTDNGYIAIRVDAQRKYTDDEGQEVYSVSIMVADSGIGIKKGDLSKLFKPFSQIDQGTTKVYKGTGLGLSISQKLANLMQGEITVESEYGVGSKFTLKFLAKKYDMLLITPEFKKEVGVLFTGRRSIIIDDNGINRTVICGILINWGMEVITCASADEALIFIQSGARFDIGIIDINMPLKDGNHLASIIRKTDLNLSLIATSSSGSDNVNMELFDDYCEKPIKEFELIGKMLALFSRPGIKQTRPLTTRVQKDMFILIVEDNLTNQLVIADKLRELGYNNYVIADNGRKGYEEIKANTRKYKLIFMDIKMPVMDGKEASIRIKNIYGWKEKYSNVKMESKKSYSSLAGSINLSPKPGKGMLGKHVKSTDRDKGAISDDSSPDTELLKSLSNSKIEKGSRKHGRKHHRRQFSIDAEREKNSKDKSGKDKSNGKKEYMSDSINYPLDKKGSNKISAKRGKNYPIDTIDSFPPKDRKSLQVVESDEYCPYICALSATSVKEEEKILLEKEIFDDYITKPIDDNELIRVLNKFEQ